MEAELPNMYSGTSWQTSVLPPRTNVLRAERNRSFGLRGWNSRRSPLHHFGDRVIAELSYRNARFDVPSRTRSTYIMAFSPDNSLLASCHGDHNIHILDIKTRVLIKSLSGHERTPWCVTFHPGSNEILASGSLNGEVRVWDLRGDGSESWTAIGTESAGIASLSFHPYDHVLAIAVGNEIHFWDWSLSQPFASVKTSSENEKVRFVRFDPWGHSIMTGVGNAEEEDEDNDDYTFDHWSWLFPITRVHQTRPGDTRPSRFRPRRPAATLANPASRGSRYSDRTNGDEYSTEGRDRSENRRLTTRWPTSGRRGYRLFGDRDSSRNRADIGGDDFSAPASQSSQMTNEDMETNDDMHPSSRRSLSQAHQRILHARVSVNAEIEQQYSRLQMLRQERHRLEMRLRELQNSANEVRNSTPFLTNEDIPMDLRNTEPGRSTVPTTSPVTSFATSMTTRLREQRQRFLDSLSNLPTDSLGNVSSAPSAGDVSSADFVASTTSPPDHSFLAQLGLESHAASGQAGSNNLFTGLESRTTPNRSESDSLFTVIEGHTTSTSQHEIESQAPNPVSWSSIYASLETGARPRVSLAAASDPPSLSDAVSSQDQSQELWDEALGMRTSRFQSGLMSLADTAERLGELSRNETRTQSGSVQRPTAQDEADDDEIMEIEIPDVQVSTTVETRSAVDDDGFIDFENLGSEQDFQLSLPQHIQTNISRDGERRNLLSNQTNLSDRRVDDEVSYLRRFNEDTSPGAPVEPRSSSSDRDPELTSLYSLALSAAQAARNSPGATRSVQSLADVTPVERRPAVPISSCPRDVRDLSQPGSSATRYGVALSPSVSRSTQLTPPSHLTPPSTSLPRAFASRQHMASLVHSRPQRRRSPFGDSVLSLGRENNAHLFTPADVNRDTLPPLIPVSACPSSVTSSHGMDTSRSLGNEVSSVLQPTSYLTSISSDTAASETEPTMQFLQSLPSLRSSEPHRAPGRSSSTSFDIAASEATAAVESLRSFAETQSSPVSQSAPSSYPSTFTSSSDVTAVVSSALQPTPVASYSNPMNFTARDMAASISSAESLSRAVDSLIEATDSLTEAADSLLREAATSASNLMQETDARNDDGYDNLYTWLASEGSQPPSEQEGHNGSQTSELMAETQTSSRQGTATRRPEDQAVSEQSPSFMRFAENIDTTTSVSPSLRRSDAFRLVYRRRRAAGSRPTSQADNPILGRLRQAWSSRAQSNIAATMRSTYYRERSERSDRPERTPEISARRRAARHRAARDRAARDRARRRQRHDTNVPPLTAGRRTPLHSLHDDPTPTERNVTNMILGAVGRAVVRSRVGQDEELQGASRARPATGPAFMLPGMTMEDSAESMSQRNSEYLQSLNAASNNTFSSRSSMFNQVSPNAIDRHSPRLWNEIQPTPPTQRPPSRPVHNTLRHQPRSSQRHNRLQRRYSVTRSNINRIISSVYAENNGHRAVVLNIDSTTYRLQWWDFTQLKLPEISRSDINVIVPHCKIYNDASIDISRDGQLLATFVPTFVGYPDSMMNVGIFSLEPSTFGQLLFKKAYGPNAVCLSISPLCNHVCVGLKSRQFLLGEMRQNKHLMAQVLEMNKRNSDEMPVIRHVYHPAEDRPHRLVSINTISWVPEVGGGIVYGTSTGDLRMCYATCKRLNKDDDGDFENEPL